MDIGANRIAFLTSAMKSSRVSVEEVLVRGIRSGRTSRRKL